MCNRILILARTAINTVDTTVDIAPESVMPKINAVLSFLVNNTPANNTAIVQENVMKTIPVAPAKKNPEDSILLLAAKTHRQSRQIAKLQAAAELEAVCIASQDAEIAKLQAQVKQLEALQTLLVRNASLQAAKVCALVNENNKLTADLDQANYVAGMNFATAKKYAALAETYKNIARSSKGRAASKFALPAIAGEVEAAELAYFDRIAIDKAEDIAESVTPTSRKLIGFGKDNVEGAYHCRACRKVEAHRGHKNGHVPMSAREAFHYLSR